MARTIIDAVLGFSFDDSASNLAAATLFYILTSDVSDLPYNAHFFCIKHAQAQSCFMTMIRFSEIYIS